jgi:hypothetical protein
MSRTYDHRIREAIVRSGDPNLFPKLNIPRSTSRAWIRRGAREVVTLEPLDDFTVRVQLSRVEAQNVVLRQVVRLLLALIRTSKSPLRDLSRLPDGTKKQTLLRVIDRARAGIPLAHALRVIGLSKSRYHAWAARQKRCSLDDRPSCPRSRPGRLTFNEITAMGDMVESSDHRHMSIRALALHAQRVGRVFAHPITWGRLIRERGWRRPRLRLYPARPKVGVKATAPNEIWHIDASVLRLLDGTRVYLHAVIDNYSRRILASCVEERLNPMNTLNVLSEAAKELFSGKTQVYMDSGVENLNRVVDPLFEGPDLERVLAQVDVTFSNSMIEAWWRSLKHQWLCLHQLDSIATVRRLVEFYVQQHNEVIPHSAFWGLTPDEVYFEKSNEVVEHLKVQRAEAQTLRLASNRKAACSECSPSPSIANAKPRVLPAAFRSEKLGAVATG